MRLLLALFWLLLVSANAPSLEPRSIGYRIVARYPHDPNAYTQGLLMREGMLYESTGRYGRSDIRRVRLIDGKVMARRTLPYTVFGEGMTDWHDSLISLTWREGIAYRWSLSTFKLKQRFRYPGEGWGLARDGTYLYMSDGTATLRVLDPETFAERRRVAVTKNGFPVPRLNELEWAAGRIYANIWQTSEIVEIDPASGKVTGVLDLSALTQEVMPGIGEVDFVLNGIAFDAANGNLLVTGKNWPTLFALKIDRSLSRSGKAAQPVRSFASRS